MKSRPSPDERRRNDSRTNDVRRRQFLALGAGAGATLLAGCAGAGGVGGSNGDDATSAPSDGATESDETTESSGAFQLLISDQPAAIGDFDRLDVSLARARIFRGEESDEETEESDGETAAESTSDDRTTSDADTATESETTEAEATTTETTETATTETETATTETTETEATEVEATTVGDAETETTTAETGTDSERGFFTVDLEGATVDLTRVVGDRAVGVFDGSLPTGRYAKIELAVDDVEGVVDGETVAVTVPSEKLQIVKPFEVVAGETLSFVFDINVVKKGKTGSYNLLPVISESGVAGRDVEVTEVGDDSEGADASETSGEETDGTETESRGGERGEGTDGPPEDASGDS